MPQPCLRLSPMALKKRSPRPRDGRPPPAGSGATAGNRARSTAKHQALGKRAGRRAGEKQICPPGGATICLPTRVAQPNRARRRARGLGDLRLDHGVSLLVEAGHGAHHGGLHLADDIHHLLRVANGNVLGAAVERSGSSSALEHVAQRQHAEDVVLFIQVGRRSCASRSRRPCWRSRA